MKKDFLIVIILLVIIGVYHSVSEAEETTISPKNVKELRGKWIVFTDEEHYSGRRSTWNLLITGTAEHFMNAQRSVDLYVSGVNYMGYEVKQITYVTSGVRSWWQIEYYVPAGYRERESNHFGHIREESKKIIVISIE